MKEIIFTAVLSAVLTVASSYFIMQSQLTSEQDYWVNRQNQERAEKKLNKQIELLESFNDTYLNLDMYTTRTMMSAAKFKADLHLCFQAYELGSKDFKCEAKTENYFPVKSKYQQQVYKLSVLMQMFPLYFSESVVSHVATIYAVIVENNKRLEGIMAQEVDGNYLETKSSIYFEQSMETSQKFKNERTTLIDAMLREIKAQENKLYNNIN